MAGSPEAAKAAMFFAGLKLLQTMNLCFAGSFPTLFKFGIPPSKIGLFMGDTGASMNYWVTWGILLSYGLSFCGWTGGTAFIAPGISTVIYCLAFAYTCRVKRLSIGMSIAGIWLVLVPIIGGLFVLAKIQDGEYGKFVCPIISCFSSVCTLFTNSIIFHVVVFGHGNEGVRKLYFWLCASALAYQFDSCMTAKVGGPHVAWYFFAMELSYFVIPLIHWTCERFHKALGVHDLNFFTVFWHVFAICIFTLMALELWIVNVYLNWDGYSSMSADMDAWTSLKRCFSPFFMGIIGMGSIFWLFPVIWPFMVCHFSHFRFVMLLGPGLGSFATLIPWALGDGHEIAKLFKNLGQFYDIKDKTVFNIWSIYDFRGGRYYHFLWLIILFIFISFGIHMSCIHYPRCFIARSVLHSRWAVVCGSLFFFFTQSAKAWGLTGCFANAIGPWFNPTGNLTIDNSVTFGGSAKVKIESGTNVKIDSFTIELDTSSTNTKNITGGIKDHSKVGGSANLSPSNKPQIVLYGTLSVGVFSTSQLSGPTSAQGTFAGNQSAKTITLSPNTLNLGFTSAKSGGDNAAKIRILTKMEITSLSTSGGLTITGGILTLVFDGGVPKNGEKFDLSNKTVSGSFNSTTPGSGAVSGSIQTGSVTIAGENVTISQLQFNTFTISNVTGVNANQSGNINSSQHTVTLYGTNVGGEDVQTDPVTAGAASSSIRLTNDSGTTLKLDASSAHNLDLNVADAQATQGKDRAGSFKSSGANDYLTKMEIFLFLASTKHINIDGFPVGGKVKLTLGFKGVGIHGNASNEFTVSNNGAQASSSGFSIDGDLAHGPVFGTVCFNFSLFHLTAALFTNQAYSVGIGSFKCAVYSGCSWPTQGIGGFRSFCWWLCYGLKKGNRRFWSLADVDIIQVIS